MGARHARPYYVTCCMLCSIHLSTSPDNIRRPSCIFVGDACDVSGTVYLSVGGESACAIFAAICRGLIVQRTRIPSTFSGRNAMMYGEALVVTTLICSHHVVSMRCMYSTDVFSVLTTVCIVRRRQLAHGIHKCICQCQYHAS